MRHTVLAAAAGLLLVVALICDQITLASGDYRGVLSWAIALCLAAFVMAGLGAVLTQHRTVRAAFVVMMLIAAAITVDAVLRLLPVW